MAFKKVADLNPDEVISLGGINKKTGKKNPASAEGYYLGSRSVEDKKKKSGNSYIHVFQTSRGSLGVWGKTDMDRKLLTVTPGVMTRVTFDKMVGTPNGDMYKFSVETDDENTIEVSGLADTSGKDDSGGNYATEEEEEDLDGTLDGEDDTGYGESASGSGYAAADQKERVAAILSKGKKRA